MSFEVRDLILPHVRTWLAAAGDAPLVVGICGSQGSGKSTVSAKLVSALAREGVSACAISIDDFYLGAEERRRLGCDVHPLLQTRGVPGTHDVPLAIATIRALRRSEPVALPSFDKASDERVPFERWRQAAGPYDVIFFEGWCVGSTPQDEDDLANPVNAFEAENDREGNWRRHVNLRLATNYRQLFGLIDRQVLLAAPSFAVVEGWRLEQEETLRRNRLAAGQAVGSLMSRSKVQAFIQHYQRLTEHILHSMPAAADLTVQLDRDRRPSSVKSA